MSYFITIQYPYQYLTITLSDNTTIISTETISKFQAVSLLIPTFNSILLTNNLTLKDIACIGINTGPGPFNTLRSIIATANGIAFAKQIPLVACNGLELLLQENKADNQVAILDAFGNDVYYAIKASDTQNYNSIENLISELNNLYTHQTIIFVGNGAEKHKEFISNNFKGTADFKDDCLFATPQSLVNETYNKFEQGLTEKEIFPLYFASPVVKS
ncbi:MAG: tRNA (adenosine(37)-N6)-threonylcarbamoyltransferase complex dimerization subunit type 1 TsaB [Candidatus Dependentiae bacterium]|nr:tRNA (adenosine(37)-N6)-threonylcarbamoyltransferase complex dimerization subunit type 1 TsaB [Candidatus Dependentiae bacterium]